MRPNFSRQELACRHCGVCVMDPVFMDALQALRDRLGFPLPITSGYRCPTHNAAVSSTGTDGPHTTGKAADIRIYGPRALLLLDAARAMGFQRIGLKQHGPISGRFIHLDMLTDLDGVPCPALWTYP